MLLLMVFFGLEYVVVDGFEVVDDCVLSFCDFLRVVVEVEVFVCVNGMYLKQIHR